MCSLVRTENTSSAEVHKKANNLTNMYIRKFTRFYYAIFFYKNHSFYLDLYFHYYLNEKEIRKIS